MNKNYLSWGKYPNKKQKPKYIFWPEDVKLSLNSAIKNNTTTLPFGLGRSYGDSCLAKSNNILNMHLMDRMISFDVKKGIIIAQSGISIEQISKISIPHGWFVPVSPGTKYVTLGGAIANDVHGKNHHTSGTFGCHVNRITIFRSEEGIVECSENLNPELFKATIGGLGLTGIILLDEFKLKKINSSNLQINNIKFNNLKEFFDLSEMHDSKHEYTASWIDCLSSGKNIGKGIYTFADHMSDNQLEFSDTQKLKIPFDIPFSLINSFTLKTFNYIYFHSQLKKENTRKTSYEKYLYPLDKILYWNRIYGKKGFQQFQCVVPKNNAKYVMKEILYQISKYKTGSFLAVLKQTGDIPSPGILSFPIPGFTLALDFPQNHKNNKDLFETLDQIVHESHGRLYPAKDAHMSKQHFQSSYPEWEKVESLRDKALLSRFWERVT